MSPALAVKRCSLVTAARAAYFSHDQDPNRTSNFNGVGRGPSQRPDPRKSISLGPEPEAIRYCIELSSEAKAIAFATAFDGKIDAC